MMERIAACGPGAVPAWRLPPTATGRSPAGFGVCRHRRRLHVEGGAANTARGLGSEPAGAARRRSPTVQRAAASTTTESDESDQRPSSAAAPPEAITNATDTYFTHLFPSEHFTPSPLLMAYFPFGCVIAGFRMALWVLLLALDLPITDTDAGIAVLRSLLGVSVAWEGLSNLPEGRHVMVSNHLTAGDLIILYMLPQKYIYLVTPALPEAVTKVKNHRVALRHATAAEYDRLATDECTTPAASAPPVHLFPEGGMTNGKAMLQFSRGFVKFSRTLPVVPMALRVDVPLEISPHTLTSSFLANLFWFSFAPWVTFTCTVLPPVRMEEGEGAGKFVQRVQGSIAEELEIPVADLTIQAKKRLVQKAKQLQD